MRKRYDEPFYPPDEQCPDNDEDVEAGIRELLESELFAVLSTQHAGQPYASLISFAATRDLKQIVFSTTRETRKYSLLEKSPMVALLVDNRSQKPPLLNYIQAVTITGEATILPEKKKWTNLLLEKHPNLREFIENPIHRSHSGVCVPLLFCTQIPGGQSVDTTPLIIPLEEAQDYPVTIIGSKALNLSFFLNQGFKVPEGFSITTQAYLNFIKEN